jgi:hypothetical protein
MHFKIPARNAVRARPETSVTVAYTEDGVEIQFLQSSYEGHIPPDCIEVCTEVVDNYRIIVKVRRR